METKDESPKSDNKIRYLDKLDGPADWLSYNELKAIAAYYQEKEKFTIHVETYADSLKNSRQIAAKATEEIYNIQRSLQEGEQVGYLYTNNATDNGTKHAEAFIISNDKITKILQQNLDSRQTLNVDEEVGSDTRVFLKKSDVLMPQKGGYECGSLSIAHLKNYLSNDAAQLRDFTLSIPYYDKQKLRYYFLPSPQVLRYSQSNLYNNFVRGIVQKGPQTLKIDGQAETLLTIEELLQKTKMQAQKLDNQELVEEIDALLERLPTFRDKWLDEYEKTEAKRKFMNTSKEGKHGWLFEYQSKSNQISNVYLIYTTKRMRKIAFNQLQKNSNPAIEILEQYQKNLSAKKSDEEILQDLENGLQKIKLCKNEEILYFLSKVDTRFYKDILSSIEGFPQSIYELNKLCLYFLTSKQEQALKDEKNFEQFIVKHKLSKDLNLTKIGNWINFLKPRTDTIEQFFQDHFEEEWLKEQFQNESHRLYKLQEEFGLGGYGSTEEERIAFAKLLNRYMPGWLEAQLPTLFADRKMYMLFLFFPNEIEREKFIDESLKKINILEILEKKSPDEAWSILNDYADRFLKKSDLLTNLGEDVLLQTLGKDKESTFLHCHNLLLKYVDTNHAVDFLYKYRERIIESLINRENLEPLGESSPFKDKLTIDFFCPEGDEILKNYFDTR